MFNSKKAQSTLEYILVFTAVVGAVIIAANTIIKPRVTSMIDHVTGQAESAVKNINFGGTTEAK